MFTSLRQLISPSPSVVFPTLQDELIKTHNAVKVLNVAEEKDISHVKQQLSRLIQSLEKIIINLYTPIVALDNHHKVRIHSELTDYLTSKMTSMIEDLSNVVDDYQIHLVDIKKLCEEVLEGIKNDVQQFEKTFAVFPKGMQQQDLVALVNIYDACQLDDTLMALIKKYMQTTQFKSKHSNDVIDSDSIELIRKSTGDAISLCKYLHRNQALSEADQALTYWLLFSNVKSKKEIDAKVIYELAKYNNESLDGRCMSNELLRIIFEYLDADSLKYTAAACTLFRGIIYDPQSPLANVPTLSLRDYSKQSTDKFKTTVDLKLNHNVEHLVCLDRHTLAVVATNEIAILQIHPSSRSVTNGRLLKLSCKYERLMLARLSPSTFVCAFGKSIQIWNWKSGKCIAKRTHTSPIEKLMVIKDGIVVKNFQGEMTVYEHDLRQNILIKMLPVHMGQCRLVVTNNFFVGQTDKIIFHDNLNVYVMDTSGQLRHTSLLPADVSNIVMSCIRGCWLVADNKLAVIRSDIFDVPIRAGRKKIMNSTFLLLNLENFEQIELMQRDIDLNRTPRIDVLPNMQILFTTQHETIGQFKIFDIEAGLLIHEGDGLDLGNLDRTSLILYNGDILSVDIIAAIRISSYPKLENNLTQTDQPVEKESETLRRQ